MSRESIAKVELDKAYQRLLENSKLTDEMLEALKNFSLVGKEVSKIDEIFMETSNLFINGKKIDPKAAKQLGMGFNVINDLANGKGLVRSSIGAGIDYGLYRLSYAIPGVGEALLVLDLLNLVDRVTFNTGAFDIKGQILDIYDKLNTDDLSDIDLTNGILKVTMPDGTVYSRPLFENISGLITGGNGWTNDVLFGGNGNDTLMGKDGSDLLIGGNGDDTYLATKGDTIKDSDGKGSVHFNGHKLTGGTYDKDRDLYISDDYIEYKLHDDGRLVVSDMGENIVIENFNKDNNDLGIILIDPKDVVVTIHDNQANEGGNGKHTLGFKVSLNRKLEAGEYLTLYINGQLVKFTENEQEKDNAYIYEWDGNESKDGDRKFEVSGSVLQSGTSKNLNVKYIHPAKGLIKDDDRDDDPDPEREYSPIVIDLGNDGINSHALNYTINFDLDNNGFKEATGWVSGDDALLAIDKNNNGIIDNGSELFGNKSISDSAFSYTNSSLNNGFETLKSYDSNNDGIIDSQDAEFDKLLLWQDKNGNAITDNGELIKLSDKVSSIDLNYTNTDINNNSNTIKQTSTATLNDGTKVKADDIWFKVNYKDTEEIIDESQIPFEIKALPNVTAFGNLHSLHYAMAKNETLATMVNLYLLMDSENLKEFANLNLLVA